MPQADEIGENPVAQDSRQDVGEALTAALKGVLHFLLRRGFQIRGGVKDFERVWC